MHHFHEENMRSAKSKYMIVTCIRYALQKVPFLHDLSQHVYNTITKITFIPTPNQITFIPYVNANKVATI